MKVEEFSRSLHNDITMYRVKVRQEDVEKSRKEFMEEFLEFIKWPDDEEYWSDEQ